jgi:hypothetical protein
MITISSTSKKLGGKKRKKKNWSREDMKVKHGLLCPSINNKIAWTSHLATLLIYILALLTN